MSFGVRYQIYATGMPRVATKNSSGPQANSSCETMFLDRFLSVVRAGRIEATLIANEIAQSVLIKGDQLDGKIIQHSLGLLSLRSGELY